MLNCFVIYVLEGITFNKHLLKSEFYFTKQTRIHFIAHSLQRPFVTNELLPNLIQSLPPLRLFCSDFSAYCVLNMPSVTLFLLCAFKSFYNLEGAVRMMRRWEFSCAGLLHKVFNLPKPCDIDFSISQRRKVQWLHN